MILESATIYGLEIPFIEGFSHSTKSRTFSDAIVVKVRSAEGIAGYGEGLPRPYVTGESRDTVLQNLQESLWPAIRQKEIPAFEEDRSLAALVRLSETIPPALVEGGVIHNAARAAMELAVIDCGLRTANIGLADVLPPKRHTVVYSGVISTSSVEGATKRARQMKVLGLDSIKVKVGTQDDLKRLEAIRHVVGPGVSLRVDANGAWTVDEAITKLQMMESIDIAAVEQPIPPGNVADLAKVRKNSSIPIMVDESLVTEADAGQLIAARACDFFNIRVSKCGGLVPTLAIAEQAHPGRIKIQVGSQVGETAILSAVGRHLAASLPEVSFVEGSFGTLLLSQDVSYENISFGYGGEAPILRGPGWGIRVLEERLEKYASTIVSL